MGPPQVVHGRATAARAPWRAACAIVPEIRNACPNQKMPISIMNIKGKTSAASAISEPSLPRSALSQSALHPINFMQSSPDAECVRLCREQNRSPQSKPKLHHRELSTPADYPATLPARAYEESPANPAAAPCCAMSPATAPYRLRAPAL